MDTRIPNSSKLDPQVRQAIDWVRRYAETLGGGVTDHGALTGLGDDDHTQYAQKANNLSDLTNAGTARTNLGLGALATKSTVATGDIDADAVTNAKLANMATATFKGRVTAGTGDPEDLTGTQATTLLDVFTSLLKGVVPASGGGTANFLRADGTWAAPSAGPGGSNTQFQYNNAGALAGTSALTLVSSVPTVADEMAFTSQTAYPATPASGTVEVGAADRTGLPLVWARTSFGFRLPVGIQGGNTICLWLPGGSNWTSVGHAPTQVGASITRISPSAPGLYGDGYHRARHTSSATGGSEASARTNATVVLPGGTQGFLWRARIIPNTLPANARGFFGFAVQATALGGSFNPGAGTNLFGFGWSAGQTTMRWIHNDGAGVPTTVDLGANFATNVAGVVFDLFIWMPPSSSTVYYAIESRSTGNVAIGSANTDLPTAACAVQMHTNNGGTASAIIYDMAFMHLESLF